MEDMKWSPESIINLILAAVTAFTAIIAIVISVVQLSRSNKQSLFDRRLNAFLKVKWMIALCDEDLALYKSYLRDAEAGPIYGMRILFGWLTNNTFLEGIQQTLTHLSDEDEDVKRAFLYKLEELKNLCEEVRLIFPKKIGFPLADFVFNYEELLVSMYRYQIAFNQTAKKCEQLAKPFPEDDGLEVNCRKVFVQYLKATFGYSEKLLNEGVLEKAKTRIRL